MERTLNSVQKQTTNDVFHHLAFSLRIQNVTRINNKEGSHHTGKKKEEKKSALVENKSSFDQKISATGSFSLHKDINIQ